MAWSTPRTWTPAQVVTAAAMNAYVRDQQLAMFPDGPTFDTWSPSYANLTIGNGTVTARYMQAGELVVCFFEFVLGSTSAVGTDPTVSTPVTANDAAIPAKSTIGGAKYADSGSDTYDGHVSLASTTTIGLHASDTASTYSRTRNLSASVPFTWTTGDSISFTAIFEAA